MTLTLHYHPLASYCWKVLIALYEQGTPFTPHLVDLGDSAARAAFQARWPLAKFPVLEDLARDRVVPESTIIIEYLDVHYPAPAPLVPGDAAAALEVRLRAPLFVQYVHGPMRRFVADRLRPTDARDPAGVAQARATLDTAYALLDGVLATRTWAAGATFTLADCAAAPALYYADKVHPLGAAHPHLTAYLARLRGRPSFARVLAEAEPYFAMFPG